ncbi:hypothetical protein TWF696_000362 [Orbilia brochopaga]|uniref:Uncharacterized protein n=1 Tax=Orbilia brochopaga TaxID=3140254 RepID=A0AAV9VBF7_9PEZI
MVSFKNIITAIFLAVMSHVCMAIPTPVIVAGDGTDLELAATPPFQDKAGITDNGGTLGDRIAIDVGHFSKLAASNPTNPELILSEAMKLIQKLANNSNKFGKTTIANPTNPGIP